MFNAVRVTAAALLTVSIAAGASVAGPPANPDATVLVLGTPSAKERPASRFADAFAARVAALSAGELTIEVIYNAHGAKQTATHATPALERLISLVRGGRLQLAALWAPSLELAGVKTFRAFHVPFLLTTKQAAVAATEGAAAARASGGLKPMGLTGLALAPQGLTRLFHVGRPILTPKDLRGATIRSSYGPTSLAALRALGAIPTDVDHDAFSRGLANGTVDGFEAPFEIAPLFASSSATAGNLVLHPTLTLLAANTAAFERLTSRQQAILRRAARQARADAIGAWDDVRDTRAYCSAGRRNVRATPAQQAAMVRLGRRVEKLFSRDPGTAAVIKALRAQTPLARSVTTPCGRPHSKPITAPRRSLTNLPPSGVYRRTLTADAMRTAGADEENIRNNSGVHTWTFRGARVTHSGRNPNSSYSCDGSLSVAGRLVRVAFDCDGGVAYLSWRRVTGGLVLENFYDNRKPFTGWDTLYNGLWTRAG